MESAFFEELRRTPFEKLTVSGIVSRAGVNRNSFYYHFTDLEDLAARAMGNLLIPEIPRMIAGGLGTLGDQLAASIGEDELRRRLGRLQVVVGPHGSAALRGTLEDAIIGVWCGAYELDADDLDPQVDASMRFVLGGAFRLVGGVDPERLLEQWWALGELPVLRSAAEVLVATLSESNAGTSRPAERDVAGPGAGQGAGGGAGHDVGPDSGQSTGPSAGPSTGLNEGPAPSPPRRSPR
jgi:AcrR family transcriptional regulator